MWEIIAPWGQWKRGDKDRVMYWLRIWAPMVEHFGKGNRFVIRKIEGATGIDS